MVPSSLLIFSCKQKTFTVTDQINFKKKGSGTKISYHLKIQMKYKVNEFMLYPFMNKTSSTAILHLKNKLEKKHTTDSIVEKQKLNLCNLPYRFLRQGWLQQKKTFFATENIKAILWSGGFMALVAIWAWRYPSTVAEHDKRIKLGQKIGWIK